jgi:hypothetical protein
VFDRAPDLTDSFRQLLPECYESTLAIGTGRRLGSPRIWWWAAAGAIAVWLLVSHAMWMRLDAAAVPRRSTRLSSARRRSIGPDSHVVDLRRPPRGRHRRGGPSSP